MTTDTTRTQIHQRLLAAVVAGALALGAQAASAADDSSFTVRYDDLNLSTPEGTRVLYQRIVHAANRVCPEVDPRDIDRYQVSKACRESAIERAVQQVHDPRLAALARSAAKG
jgi:UrcA family protein